MYEFASTAARRLALILLALMARSLLTRVAVAWESDPDRGVVIQHGSIGELHLFHFQRRREGFQQEQARLREVDRLRAADQQRRPNVPRSTRRCLPAPFGNDPFTSCR